MSVLRRELEIYLNVERGRLVDSDGANITTQLILQRGTELLWKVHLVDNNNTAIALSAGTTFLFGVDSVHIVDNDDLVQSLDAQFNTGAWADEDVSQGKISCIAQLNTTELKNNFSGDVASKNMFCCFWAQAPGGNWYLLSEFTVTMQNPAVDPTSPAPTPEATYVTNDSLAAQLELKADGSVVLRNINGATMQTWTPA